MTTAISYQVVRNLAAFSLVTKLTKSVSESAKNTWKGLRNVFYDVKLARNDIAILDTFFQVGWNPADQTIKLVILWFLWPGSYQSSSTCISCLPLTKSNCIRMLRTCWSSRSWYKGLSTISFSIVALTFGGRSCFWELYIALIRRKHRRCKNVVVLISNLLVVLRYAN